MRGEGCGEGGSSGRSGGGGTMTTATPQERRRWRRSNGFQSPLHPQQLLGWAFLLGFAAGTFLLLVPSLSPSLWPPLNAVLGSLFISHIAAHLLALLLDPADAELRRLPPSADPVPEFDRSKHAHVIENGRCHLCNIQTSGPRTKHCSVCNKCVGRFDHHCKWLNHCIGGRNYAPFLVCVVTAVLASLIILGLSLGVLVLYHTDQSWLAIWYSSPFDGHPYRPPSFNMFALDDRLFLVLVALVFLFSAVAAGLLTHLCLFHAYISYRGITTYEYIRNYRQMASNLKRNTSTLPPNSDSSEPIFTVQTDYQRNGGSLRPPMTDNYCSSVNEISYRKKSVSSQEEEDSGSVPRITIEKPLQTRSCWRFFKRTRRRTLNIQSKREIKSESKDSFVTTISTISNEKRCSFERLPSLKRTSSFPIEERKGVVEGFENHRAMKSGSSTHLVVRKSCPGCRYCKMLKADPTLRDQIDAYKRKSSRRRPISRKGGNWLGVICSDVEGSTATRRNQIGPAAIRGIPSSKSAGSLHVTTYIPAKEAKRSRSMSSLPALPPPARRQLHAVSLKELSEVLSAVQPAAQTKKTVVVRPPSAPRRRHISRKNNPMSPTLSPIHESGLSNPSTPHMATRPRQAAHLWTPPTTSPLAVNRNNFQQ